MLNKEITNLTDILRPHFSGNRSRIECMAAIILGMISAGTVNMSEIAVFVQCKLLHESMYKRIQGFFTEFALSLTEVAQFVLFLLPFNGSYRLVFDRTNWKFGKSNINYFVLAICYRNVSIPIFWINLDKRDCSSDAEKIELLDKFRNLFGFEKVVDLLGDREFISEKLLAYCRLHNLRYTLRVKCDHLVTNAQGVEMRADKLFKDLNIGQANVLYEVKLLGNIVHLCAIRLKNKELKIIATNHSPERAIARYEDREEIERMFSCLKRRGFNLEDTHMTNPVKLERLLGVVAIAFCWAYKLGDYIDEQKPIARKPHGRRIRSIFKTGFVYLRNLLAGVGDRAIEYINVLAFVFEKDRTAKPYINWGYV
jgi:hypothetical protein